MLKFLYSDTNVTPELQQQVSKLLTESQHQLLGSNAALFLTKLLQNNIGESWSVFIYRQLHDLQYVIRSPTNIVMDIEMTPLRIILSQNPNPQGDQQIIERFDEVTQNIFDYIAKSEHLPNDLINDMYKQLEDQVGEGCNIIMALTENPNAILHLTEGHSSQPQVMQVDENTVIHTIIYYTLPFQSQYQGGDVINDEYEEPMDLLFTVMLEEQHFKQSNDQIKVSFDQLEIQPLKLRSFSLLFQVIVSPQPKDIKDDLNIISTGSSLMSKNMTFGINREQLFFFNFQCITGKQEQLYSQMKVKRNQLYQVALVYTNQEYYKEVSMYINGKVENQISISQNIEPPRGFFWIGSEQALKLFKGTVRDVVFVAQSLHHKHVKNIYAELTGALQHNFQRHTTDIVKDALQTLKDEIPNDDDISVSKFTQNQSMIKTTKQPKIKTSRRQQIPLHLQKQYLQFEEAIDQHKAKLIDIDHPKSRKEIIQILQQQFNDNEYLMHKCHEVSINFYWFFTSLTQLAPALEENGQPKLPFEYLHQELLREKFEQYPVYAIEVERLAKVIHHAGIQLSIEEIYNLAQITETLRHQKKYGNYVLYDKFLLLIREASLSQQEIELVQSQYNTDEKEADQDLLVVTEGISRNKQINTDNFTFSFFKQLKTLIGSEQEAFKFNIQHLVAYSEQNKPYIQRLTAIYVHKESGQKVEIEGIEFYNLDSEKIQLQKIDISDEIALKYFRVHYNGENMAMIAFKTHQEEETFQIDRNFQYVEGQDATGFLETYALQNIRLAGFSGQLIRDQQGLTQLIAFHAEYLKKDPRVEEQKKQQPEQLPVLPENWNQGKFQIIVNRCSECDKHNTTTWHDEADFAQKFNELGQIFKDLFPNVEIIGNWDKTQQLEHFDVYVRGIGVPNRFDKEGRIFLLTKNEKLKSFLDSFLKRILRVYDEIVLMAQTYGDTIEMQKKQELFLKTQNYPPKSKQAHEFPCPVPDRIEKHVKEENISSADYICKNWGCGQQFKYEGGATGIKKCRHHPGRYEFGSKHGLWPECWTCCGKTWETEGCKIDFHRGVPEKDNYSYCVNIGPVDPKTGYPETACGQRFNENDSGDCKVGSGGHQTARWPDPKAKILFFQKVIVNPALKDHQQNIKHHLRPDMFRETIPYHEFINKDRQKQLKLIETEKELRQCVNWACNKQYKEIDNRKKRMCICHPGVFDFGYTAKTIIEAVEEYKQEKGSKILWKPHWTCCRKPWNEQGCSLQQHNGPLVTEYVQKKYLWPDPNAQVYFKKKVSENWTKMLNNHHSLQPDQASMKFDSLCKALGSGGSIPQYKLPELCDKFKLNLWVCSEDLSFQFKFQDVMTGHAQDYLADSHQNIDKHKFLDWWFADVNRLKEIQK